MNFLLQFSRKTRSGFSLLEVLLVILFLAALLVLIGSYTGSPQQNMALTQCSDLISQTLDEAHQIALTQNRVVEVRLYATIPNATPLTYNAIQLFFPPTIATTYAAASGYQQLPTGFVLDGTERHSPLLTQISQIVTDPDDHHATIRTHCFHFLPDGSTDLDPQQAWFVTVREEVKSDPLNFPKDWVAVQLDPVTGRVRVVRP